MLASHINQAPACTVGTNKHSHPTPNCGAAAVNRYVNMESPLKIFTLVTCLLFLFGCQTTVAEYNVPKSFTSEINKIEVWMNDDGLNSAVFLSINDQDSWQRKSLQGSAKSVFLAKGPNKLTVRLLYQEFMKIMVENELNIQHSFDPQFKYVFVPSYNKSTKSFSYRFEQIDKNAICVYGSTNFKRIITGKLTCKFDGKVYKFT
jgi:hypothetical protein